MNSNEAADRKSPSTPSLLAQHFDCRFYVLQAGEEICGDPIQDFLESGWSHGHDPAPWFSCVDYLDEHPDVRDAGLNPFVHYIEYGWGEGRRVSASRHQDKFWESPVTVRQPVPQSGPQIALITKELPGFGSSGGIGTASIQLACLLAQHGHCVQVYWLSGSASSDLEAQQASRDLGVNVRAIQRQSWSDDEGAIGDSLAVHRFLAELPKPPSLLIGPDYGGILFHTLQARRMGIAHGRTKVMVALHGTTRWALELDGSGIMSDEQLLLDFMERRAIQDADQVVGLSHYCVDWHRQAGFFDASQDVPVLCNPILVDLQSLGNHYAQPTDQLIIVGKHQDKKGISQVLRAVSAVSDSLRAASIGVSVIGHPGELSGLPSVLFLDQIASKWNFEWSYLPSLSTQQIVDYYSRFKNPLVLIPSPVENCPYALLEPLALGLRVLSSSTGGGTELLHSDSLADWTIDTTSEATIAAALERALLQVDGPKPAERVRNSTADWLRLIAALCEEEQASPPRLAESEYRWPSLSIVIVHHERPGKLLQAVQAVEGIPYEGQLKVLVVDDGSRDTASREALDWLVKRGVQVLREEGSYLGAARNAALKAAETELIVFLDDDDLCFPSIASALVSALLTSGADAVVSPAVTFDHSMRGFALTYPECIPRSDQFTPLGGPLSLALRRNVLGGAVGIHYVSKLKALGGFTELKGVGYEDYEVWARYLANGLRIRVHLEPQFMYEVGKPSMLSTTSAAKGMKRVLAAFDGEVAQTAMHDFVAAGVTAVGWRIDRDRLDFRVEQLVGLARWREAVKDLPSRPSAPDWLAFSEGLHLRFVAEGLRRGMDGVFSIQPRGGLPTKRVQNCEPSFTELLEGVLDPAIDPSTVAVELLRRRHAGTLKVADEGDLLLWVQRLRVLPIADRVTVLSVIADVAEDAGLHRVMNSALLLLVESEEMQYRSRYPGIRVGTGSEFVSGLQHFVNFGRSEGRIGYEGLLRLIKRRWRVGDDAFSQSILSWLAERGSMT